MTDLDAYIAGLPKAELHLHIEGQSGARTDVRTGAAERRVHSYDSVEAVRAAYDFSNLQISWTSITRARRFC